MTTPSFPNPLAGVIHDQGWVRPAGNTDFVLTKNAVQHVASGGPKANDYGDRDVDQDPAFAIISGKVVTHREGDGVITLESLDGLCRVVCAHFAIDALFASFPVGTIVYVGTVIGHVSNTHPTLVLAPHLHLQIAFKINGVWVWQDPWPLLAQNQEEPMTKIIAILPAGNAVIPPNSRTYAAPSFTAAYANTGTAIRTVPAVYVVADADGNTAEWVEMANNGVRRYIPKLAVTLVATPTYTQAQVDAKVTATAGAFKAKASAYNADVQND